MEARRTETRYSGARADHYSPAPEGGSPSLRKRRGVLTLQINNPVTLVPLVELSSTATMAMGACGCSLAMRLSVVTSVVNPLRSATASSSLSGSERQSWKTATPPRRRRATVGVARVGAATRRRQGGPSRVGFRSGRRSRDCGLRRHRRPTPRHEGRQWPPYDRPGSLAGTRPTERRPRSSRKAVGREGASRGNRAHRSCARDQPKRLPQAAWDDQDPFWQTSSWA